MNHSKGLGMAKGAICVGTGLVALDVLLTDTPNCPPKLWAGGSCGNVLTILSYFGWKSYPVARLGSDPAATEVLSDLERWGVKTCLISQNETDSTPIVIERLRTNTRGVLQHKFEWVCPTCGSPLPKYRPVLAKVAKQLVDQIPRPAVFYFDRVTPSSVDLGTELKRRGALVVFEPSGVGDESLFAECLGISDVVKYSQERFSKPLEPKPQSGIALEIQTLGAQGLRFRLHKKTARNSNAKWHHMPGYPVENLRDTVGSGDWCTAGLVHYLCSTGRTNLRDVSLQEFQSALRFGQALAALNCYYEGARGSMYKLSKPRFLAIVKDIMQGVNARESIEQHDFDSIAPLFEYICPHCPVV
jgi:fructokinase